MHNNFESVCETFYGTKMKYSLIGVAVIILSFNDICVKAKCCIKMFPVTRVIGNGESVHYHICRDGTVVENHFCAYGKCNIFGCACDSECRDNPRRSWLQAVRIFEETHPNEILK